MPGFNYHPTDVHVGKRLRQRRMLLGISQTALGRQVGMTYQQVQKYEKGANRVSASLLFDLSSALAVPVDYFFANLPREAARAPSRDRSGNTLAYAPPAGSDDPAQKRETLQLVRNYYRISNPAVRRHLRGMVVALAEQGPRTRAR